MGTSYYIIPLGQEADVLDRMLRAYSPQLALDIEGEGGLAQWSERRGIELPVRVKSRYPTPREVVGVLHELAGLRYRIDLGWITVLTYMDEHEHTYLASYGFQGGPDDPWPFFYEKGSRDLAQFLTAQIARIAGPLLFQADDADARLELISSQTENAAYATTPAHDDRRLVRWSRPLWHQPPSRSTRLLPFPEPDSPRDGFLGLQAFLKAYDIAFPEPLSPGHLLTQDDLRGALNELPKYRVAFRMDEVDDLCADIYLPNDDNSPIATVCCPQYWPHEARFVAGEIDAQVAIAEVLARQFGPYVLLPSHLSPVPILVQAGADPGEIVADWHARTRRMPS